MTQNLFLNVEWGLEGSPRASKALRSCMTHGEQLIQAFTIHLAILCMVIRVTSFKLKTINVKQSQ